MSFSAHTKPHLLLRAFMPTLAIVGSSSVIAIVLIGGHILFLSVQSGTLWPSAFDGYFGSDYTNAIVQPILSFSNHPLTSIIVSIIMWSVAGGTVYALLEGTFKSARAVKIEQSQAQIVEGVVRKHPLQRTLLAHIVWRFGIGCCFVAFIFAAKILIAIASQNDKHIFLGMPWPHILLACIESLGIGVTIGYVGTVLLRLYLFRTRLFGEII